MITTASLTRLGVGSTSVSGLLCCGIHCRAVGKIQPPKVCVDPAARQTYVLSSQPCFECLPHLHFGLGLLEVLGQPRPWFSCCLSVAQISKDLEVGCTVVADSKGRGRTTSTFDQYCGVGHFPFDIQSILTHLCPT